MTSLLMQIHFEMYCFYVALSQLSNSRHERTRVKEHLPFHMFQNQHLEGPNHAKLAIKRDFLHLGKCQWVEKGI